MKRFLSRLALVILTGAILVACDDDSLNIGSSIMPQQDFLSSAQQYFQAYSRTAKTTPVLAKTNSSYLGSVIDPESGARTTSSFVMQFHIGENYTYPERSRMIIGEQGSVEVDSCVLRIASNDYFGDSLNVMKMQVLELDTARLFSPTAQLYSDFDAMHYVNTKSPVNHTLSYTVFDLTQSSTQLNSNSSVRTIRVDLGKEYGNFVVNKFYENPKFFDNSYEFAHHVCPGFFIKHAGGVGTMITSNIAVMDIYFRYHDTTDNGQDTIIGGMSRFAATEEVLQSTTVSNDLPTEMLNTRNYTYVKSPAALHTEITLPISEILAKEHYRDTINSISLTLKAVSETNANAGQLPLPEALLLVRIQDSQSFFATQEMANGLSSFVSTATKVNNQTTYAFENLARLITLLRDERDTGADIKQTDTDEQRARKWEKWETQHPNWNRVALLPVKPEYLTTSSSSGSTITTMIRIHPNFGLSSVKLAGGEQQPLQISTIYSSFNP